MQTNMFINEVEPIHLTYCIRFNEIYKSEIAELIQKQTNLGCNEIWKIRYNRIFH